MWKKRESFILHFPLYLFPIARVSLRCKPVVSCVAGVEPKVRIKFSLCAQCPLQRYTFLWDRLCCGAQLRTETVFQLRSSIARLPLALSRAADGALCFAHPGAGGDELGKRTSRLLGLLYFISPVYSTFQFSS